MTGFEVADLVGLVGIDIIFLGLISMLTGYIARQLWRSTPNNSIAAFKEGWADFCSYLSGSIDGSEIPAPKSQLIAMLIVAAVVGMLANIAADRMLDTKINIQIGPFSLTRTSFEDKIKADALHSVADGLDVAEASHTILSEHDSESNQGLHHEKIKAWEKRDTIYIHEKDGEERESTVAPTPQPTPWATPEKSPSPDVDNAKELFNHASLKVLPGGDGAMLHYEYFVVKVLRVLMMDAVFLFLTLLAGPIRRGPYSGRQRAVDGRTTVATSWCKVATPNPHDDVSLPGRRIFLGRLQASDSAIVHILIFASLPCIFFWLWKEQSRHYDIKVIHAYVIAANDADATLNYPTPEPKATATPAPAPAATTASASVPLQLR